MVDHEGAPLNLSETARVAPLEGEMAEEPIPDLEHAVDEFALHDTFAHILQALADKYGVRVTKIVPLWTGPKLVEVEVLSFKFITPPTTT